MSSKSFPRRYEIYFADLNPTVGGEIRKIRPVVIVSPDAMNARLDTVVACPLTSKVHRRWRSRVPVKFKNINGEIAIDQIRTISKQRLKKKIGKLGDVEARETRIIITEMYGE